jgi:leader peptidase (prepilin peptidase)/N-methyltransferase
VILLSLILFFIFGLFFGSFFGVLVDRLPRGETVIKGHSHCEFCKKTLKWYDLIPVFSFLSTGGKCRYCHKSLSLYYPIIEILTGIMFSLTYIFVISNFKFLIPNQIPNLNFLITIAYYLFIMSAFIAIFFTDLKSGIIPDKILLPAVIITLLYQLIFNPSSLVINVVCGIAAFLFFILISVVFKVLTKKDSMGGGDIKLAFLLGLFLGFPNIIISLYVAFLTGALVGIILIIWRKKSFQKATLPFGPFLILGAIISLYLGNAIYLQALHVLGLP